MIIDIYPFDSGRSGEQSLQSQRRLRLRGVLVRKHEPRMARMRVVVEMPFLACGSAGGHGVLRSAQDDKVIRGRLRQGRGGKKTKVFWETKE